MNKASIASRERITDSAADRLVVPLMLVVGPVVVMALVRSIEWCASLMGWGSKEN